MPERWWNAEVTQLRRVVALFGMAPGGSSVTEWIPDTLRSLCSLKRSGMTIFWVALANREPSRISIRHQGCAGENVSD